MSKAVTAINTPNETRYFYPADQNWEFRRFKIKASVAYWVWIIIVPEVASNTSTWYYMIAASGVNTSGQNIQGILMEPTVATDDDYTSTNKYRLVAVPKSPLAKCFFKVWTWTFSQIDVGKVVALHSDFKSLAVDTAWIAATITDYISSTQWKCQLITTTVSQTA